LLYTFSPGQAISQNMAILFENAKKLLNFIAYLTISYHICCFYTIVTIIRQQFSVSFKAGINRDHDIETSLFLLVILRGAKRSRRIQESVKIMDSATAPDPASLKLRRAKSGSRRMISKRNFQYRPVEHHVHGHCRRMVLFDLTTGNKSVGFAFASDEAPFAEHAV
jgi:hypothetical protein